MNPVTPGTGTSPSVRLVSPYTGATARRITGVQTAGKTNARRLTAWIVRSIMIATTAFALLDLFLLASGGHH